jgi:AraC-like DNA-binding protein
MACFRKAIILPVVIAFLSASGLPGENIPALGFPFIRNFTPREYNAHSQNWCVIQDNRGMMYFANTNGGIIEFDGSRWRRIHVSDNSAVRSLAADADGTIYAGSNGDFGFLYCDAKGEKHYISLLNPNSQPGHRVNSQPGHRVNSQPGHRARVKKEDRDFGYVLNIHITSHGIYFNARSRMFRLHNNILDVFPIDASLFSFAVYDQVLIPNSGGGITVFKPGVRADVKPGPATILASKFRRGAFGNILVSPYNKVSRTILIATEKQGFYLYNLSGPSVLKRFPTEIDDFLRQNVPYATARLSPNCFAYGTLCGGIVFMDRKGKLLKIIDKKHGLQDNSIWGLYPDRDRNLWVTANIGISYIETSSPLTRFTQSSGIDGVVLALEKFRKDIYIGTFTGIFRLRLTDKQPYFRPISSDKSECWDFLQVNDSLLAAGKGGVVRIEGDNTLKLTKQFPGHCLGRSDMIPGVVFCGGRRGLAYLEIKAPGTFVFKGEIEGIHSDVLKIMAGDNYDLWLTTRYKGILHLKFKDMDIAHPVSGLTPKKHPVSGLTTEKHPQITRYGVRHGLPKMGGNWIHCIGKDIFAATSRGIYKVVPGGDTGLIVSRDTRYGFVPETTFGKQFTQIAVTQFSPDRDNRYWINSARGFGALSRQGTEGEYLWDPVPFKNIYGEFVKYFVQQDGTILLASDSGEGLIRYDPGIKKNYKRNYNALIRKVTVKNQSGHRVFFSRQPGHRVIFYGDRQPEAGGAVPVLDYRDNTLLFEYTSIFYENPDAARFKYMLEGFDEDWSDWTADTSREYNKLPFGKYCFKVKGLNTFRHESSEAYYRFTISPPWYHTTAAYICYTLLLMVFVVFAIMFHFYRIRQVITRERKKYHVDPGLEDRHLKKLLRVMEKEKPYLDSGLNLDTLAEKIFIPSYQLSNLINKKLHLNFFNFINQFRVNEAIEKLSGPEGKSKNIMQIAYDVGFNTQSSFNSAFKKFTGTSPSKFKKCGDRIEHNSENYFQDS